MARLVADLQRRIRRFWRWWPMNGKHVRSTTARTRSFGIPPACRVVSGTLANRQRPVRAARRAVALERAICEGQRDLDRLAAALDAAAPDVLIIVGDDEQELFSLANFPAVSIFYGERATMKKMTLSPDPEFAWRKTVSVGYGMDKQYQHVAAPELARELIDRLMDDGFDIGAAARCRTRMPKVRSRVRLRRHAFDGAASHSDRAGDGQLLLSAESAEARALLRTRQALRRAVEAAPGICASRSSRRVASAISSPMRRSTSRCSMRCDPTTAVASRSCRPNC